MTATQIKTAQVGDNQVTYAKMQDISATDKLLGRSTAGAGDTEEITCTSFGRDLLDDTSVAAQRTTLGLGTMATQAASAVSITGGTITGLGAPTASSDAATKSYVDNLAQGMQWKNPVQWASTVNVTIASFADGSAMDGNSVANGDRVLLKNQTAPAENGIYDVHLAGPLTRCLDADTGIELVSAVVFVEGGSANADKAYVCTNDGVPTLGTTAITWVTFGASVGALLAANNLSDLLSAATARTNLGLGAMALVASVTLTGDVTGSGTSSFAATIAASAVTNAKMADMAQATVKGRASGAGTGAPTDLSAAQLLAIVGTGTHADNEDLSGTKNGSNPTFTIAHTPISGSVQLFHNGQGLRPGAGNDYTISGSTITMLTVHIPVSTDELWANYRY